MTRTTRDQTASAPALTARRAIALACALLLAGPAAAAPVPVDYTRDIKPVLKERCYSCHGALQQKAGLRLDTGEFIRRGARSGPILHPNAPERSPLLDRLTTPDPDDRMPPEGEPLTGAQIATIRSWVAAGAPSPTHEEPEPDPSRHWAFQKVGRPAVPAVQRTSWVRNPIDAFVAASHEERGFRPRREASRAALLRRVHLDLTGLPPTRDQLVAFLADSRPDAYERVVEELLASPHHGERWARHWMDVWRYADWYGRRNVPDVWNSAPQIWRWRDWIIDALNRDKGYDRMLVEMLAGDEVAPGDETVGVATGFLVRNWYALNPNQWMRDNVEHTAKAFLGLTLNCAHCHDHKYDPISNRDYFQFRAFFEPIGLRQDWVEGETDPGPFQKYDYSVLRKVVKQGAVRVFDENPEAKTQIYLRGDERTLPPDKPTVEPAIPAIFRSRAFQPEPVPLPITTRYPAAQPWIREALLDEARQTLADARGDLTQAACQHAAARSEAGRALGFNPEAPGVTRDLEGRARLVADLLRTEAGLVNASNQVVVAQAKLDSLQARLLADAARLFGGFGDTNELAAAASRAERTAALATAQSQLGAAGQSLALLQGEHALAAARRAAEKTGVTAEKKALETEETAVRKAREQLATLQKAVDTATAAAATNSTAYTPLSPSYPERSTGRRRALAAWIASTDNPLTARVAVNQVWMRHFHTPLVASVFDFGRNGSAPTHPELLDWLAAELMENGWSLKHLHRLIVTSSTYRQASSGEGLPAASNGESTAAAPESADPENRFLWRMNVSRLESEIVRDALLAASGELDRTVGGPVQPNTAAMTSPRRSIYFEVFPEDGGSDPLSRQFDPPDPNECYRRTRTVTPQQALALTNSRFTHDRSRALARRLEQVMASPSSRAGIPSDRAFIQIAFEQLLSRTPTAAETEACTRFLEETRAEARAKTPSPTGPALAHEARVSLVHAVFNHNDFVSVR